MGKAPVPTRQGVHPQTGKWTRRSLPCPTCHVRLTCHHAYIACPNARRIWQTAWTLLQALLPSCPSWPEPSDDELLLGFPDLEQQQPTHLRSRIRSWFTTTLLGISHAFRGSHEPATLLRTFQHLQRHIHTHATHHLFQFAASRLHGPARLASSTFFQAWLDGNDVLVWHKGRIGLCLETLQRLDTQDQQAPPNTPAATPASDTATPSPPDQAWSRHRLKCACCHEAQRREQTSKLCAPCWQDTFRTPPHITLKTVPDRVCACTATAPPPPQDWNLLRESKCACCGLQRYLDSLSKRCVPCWIFHFKQRPNTPFGRTYRLDHQKCGCDPNSRELAIVLPPQFRHQAQKRGPTLGAASPRPTTTGLKKRQKQTAEPARLPARIHALRYAEDRP